MTILVTGSTGHVGSAVLKELGKRHVKVRALVRQPEAKVPAGVEVVVGDLLDPVSIDKALEGVDKLYLLNAVVPDELTQGLIAYGLAKKRKLKHVVYHSVFKVEEFKDVPHLRMMFQGYLERGFVASEEDVATLTALLGHAPRRYVDFAKETALAWKKEEKLVRSPNVNPTTPEVKKHNYEPVAA